MRMISRNEGQSLNHIWSITHTNSGIGDRAAVGRGEQERQVEVRGTGGLDKAQQAGRQVAAGVRRCRHAPTR